MQLLNKLEGVQFAFRTTTKKHMMRLFFSEILFLGCALYVAFEGYKCFSKYLKEPVSVDIFYDFTGQVLAPSFTLCTQSYNYRFDSRFPDSYDEHVLERCNITRNEYRVILHLSRTCSS